MRLDVHESKRSLVKCLQSPLASTDSVGTSHSLETQAREVNSEAFGCLGKWTAQNK
jgi:hypothetical protein